MYDVFLSHASEDKEPFVRPLADALTATGLRVWYDEFALIPGASLRQSIDEGLRHSNRCVLVLSPAFFAKRWTTWELNGIVQRHVASAEPVIIPIWYRVSAEDVLAASPSIADLVAIRGDRLLTDIAAQITALVRPVASSLVLDQPNSQADALAQHAFHVLSQVFPTINLLAVLISDPDNLRYVAAVPPLPDRLRQLLIPKSHSVTGRAALTKKVIAILDTSMMVGGGSSYVNLPAANSVVAVPVTASRFERDIVVMVGSSQPRVFDTDNKLQLVVAVAEFLGIAVAETLSLAPSENAG
jgi:hypothetical protein